MNNEVEFRHGAKCYFFTALKWSLVVTWSWCRTSKVQVFFSKYGQQNTSLLKEYRDESINPTRHCNAELFSDKFFFKKKILDHSEARATILIYKFTVSFSIILASFLSLNPSSQGDLVSVSCAETTSLVNFCLDKCITSILLELNVAVYLKMVLWILNN
jgi:hypothetical protein